MSKKKTKDAPVYMKINILVLQILDGFVELEILSIEKLKQMQNSLFDEIAHDAPDSFNFERETTGYYTHKKLGDVAYVSYGPMYRTRYGFYMPVIMKIGYELQKREKRLAHSTIENVLNAEKDSPMFKNIGVLWDGYACMKNELPSRSQELVRYLREMTDSSAKITPQMHVSFRHTAFPIESVEDVSTSSTYYQILIFNENGFILYELDIVENDNGKFHLKELEFNNTVKTVEYGNDWNEVINYLKGVRDDN